MGAELANLLLSIIQILSLLIFARAIFSWFDPGFSSQIGRVLFQITEPIIAPVRQVLPPMGMLDLSVLVTLILLMILQQLIRSALVG
ncbi:MAG TPA: YggT family protein [Thermomicrobiales bacterium]|nr:YggT family protein [Thermomicrobiales bacterium]